MITIKQCPFDNNAPLTVSKYVHSGNKIGYNWPVVYIINNDTEAYVGETVKASRRMEQHLKHSERRVLTELRIITDDSFNKSAILDLESFLIRYMSSDGKFILQNENNGIQNHDYFNKSEYQELFEEVWKKLIAQGLAVKQIPEIENTEMFKYSPYKELGDEQIDSEKEILHALAQNADSPNGTTIIVRGGAGTGKTILAIYIIKLLKDIQVRLTADSTEEQELLEEYLDYFEESVLDVEKIQNIDRIGIVVPQSSLQKSLKEVFSKVKGLNSSMVLSPNDVVKNYINSGIKYDLLVVDEAHRLRCRYKGHLSNYKPFDYNNQVLGLDKQYGTELDWILKCSRNQIFFRDELQTVRPCDIDGKDFISIINKHNSKQVESALSTQWRCKGGNDYIDYLKQILACNQAVKFDFDNYDVKLFESCENMIAAIKQKNLEMGLCRVAAGFAWPWKAKHQPEINDVVIQGREYHWNRTDKNWITSSNSINEIGCIHTVQGYDLNYAGIIIGEDIKYDSQSNNIYPDKTCYFDQQGKSGVADKPEELKEYLLNIYLTLLTRGIKGTYIYVCNKELKEYFSKFFDVI